MTNVDLTTDQQSSTLDKPEDSIQCEAFIATALVFNGVEIPFGRTEQCPKVATQQMMFTCCGATAYACDEHAEEMPDVSNDEPFAPGVNTYAAVQCPRCGHVCIEGTCYHVVSAPI